MIAPVFLASDFLLPIDDLQLVISMDCDHMQFGGFCRKAYGDIVRGK
jgi:hypothetical protein